MTLVDPVIGADDVVVDVMVVEVVEVGEVEVVVPGPVTSGQIPLPFNPVMGYKTRGIPPVSVTMTSPAGLAERIVQLRTSTTCCAGVNPVTAEPRVIDTLDPDAPALVNSPIVC